jgi:RTX calcium-binding nonapeptide repeat (4 copies)
VYSITSVRPRGRSRRALLAGVLAAAAAACALPAAAEAAVVTQPPGTNQLNVTAAAGEVNQLRISDQGPTFVRIRDALPLSESTSACESLSSAEVRCAVDQNTAIVVQLGDRNDRAEVASTLRVVIEGSPGNDTYSGGLFGPSRVLFVGGADFDTASYADSTAFVTVRVGDGPGDGRTGDQDEIRDAERVIGSRIGDELDTSRLRLPIDTSLDGGGGSDILIGGAGRDVIVGGAGVDFMSGRAGVDRLVASDADRDTLDCGTDAPDEALVHPVGESSTTACERIVTVRPPASSTGPVGRLSLRPKALHAEAGEVARLRLSWRHPRSWRRLRLIELRVVHGDRRLGAVAIRPRGRRINARGVVELVRRAGRIKRTGKSVSVRLALRLDRSLAGRRLRFEVVAVDRRGRRQIERNAGSIRIAR